ncbi:N-glycosylation protein-domain-containing protein [Annulohypoxylon maeteangense]|uniref:N-glycosylation protein-domain-containing protein n=1 Tax=Annulohypoxylon maeteangense TaxID=1927788 RepID=UPI0020073085|nr:N-glycosylation protein-domain-containing protein [Annulohypoxylon maeteangense]KAI0886084.1 N-glycosylation protein-domain-containing protein [Annulohypoxylon maeteangense]
MARPLPASSSSSSPPLNSSNGNTKPNAPVVAVSLLQPRVAVALGVPKRWHHTLSACRLLSIVPPIFWGIRFTLRFLLADLLRLSDHRDYGRDTTVFTLRLTETALAIIWCCASAYLAFFFADCLMSRWLINYTPQATVVRLLTISCAFAYLTSWVVYLTGGSQDPGLLLPAWVGIATILTTCYHFTQRKIKIRKETFASISVFSIASFISMVALLFHSHWTRIGYQNVPLVALTKRVCQIACQLLFRVLGVTRDVDNL